MAGGMANMRRERTFEAWLSNRRIRPAQTGHSNEQLALSVDAYRGCVPGLRHPVAPMRILFWRTQIRSSGAVYPEEGRKAAGHHIGQVLAIGRPLRHCRGADDRRRSSRIALTESLFR